VATSRDLIRKVAEERWTWPAPRAHEQLQRQQRRSLRRGGTSGPAVAVRDSRTRTAPASLRSASWKPSPST